MLRKILLQMFVFTLLFLMLFFICRLFMQYAFIQEGLVSNSELMQMHLIGSIGDMRVISYSFLPFFAIYFLVFFTYFIPSFLAKYVRGGGNISH